MERALPPLPDVRPAAGAAREPVVRDPRAGPRVSLVFPRRFGVVFLQGRVELPGLIQCHMAKVSAGVSSSASQFNNCTSCVQTAAAIDRVSGVCCRTCVAVPAAGPPWRLMLPQLPLPGSRGAANNQSPDTLRYMSMQATTVNAT